MIKKFVIALHGAHHLRDSITGFFSAKGWRLWHWYADLWLLSEVPDLVTAGSLYQELEKAIPGLLYGSLLVLEIGPELRYYGRAPQSEAWNWMREFWGIPDFPPATNQAPQPVQPGSAE